MKQYKNLILGRLLDKYEHSKSFAGTNSVNQSFSVKLGKEFPEYENDSKYEDIAAVQAACAELEELDLISAKRTAGGLLSEAKLNINRLDACYALLKRKPKAELNAELSALLDKYSSSNELLSAFCAKQKLRISENRKPEHFNGDINEYEQALKAIAYINHAEQEMFERDFSMLAFGDSKTFEKIKSTVVSILFEYGDFPEKETLLEDLNIVKNPGHIYFKGAGTVSIAGQTIDISKLPGDIAVSSSLLKSISNIHVSGDSVVTIENLTTFNACVPKNEFVIYLGGYHNSARREFLKQLYKFNPGISYRHFGDIDAGGFYILLHLREKTGIHFMPMNMDVATLRRNARCTKPLTDNDRHRLQNIHAEEFADVIRYMLENNCKLEQEALDITPSGVLSHNHL